MWGCVVEPQIRGSRVAGKGAWKGFVVGLGVGMFCRPSREWNCLNEIQVLFCVLVIEYCGEPLVSTRLCWVTWNSLLEYFLARSGCLDGMVCCCLLVLFFLFCLPIFCFCFPLLLLYSSSTPSLLSLPRIPSPLDLCSAKLQSHLATTGNSQLGSVS